MTGQTQDRPTLRMVAKEAGVSVATVSYVLSGRHRSHTIKDSTADRVREAASRLGYRRNDAARAIRTGKSDLVLLSLSVLADPWSQAVAATVSTAVSPLGKTALIVADGDWRTVLSNRTPDVIFIDSVSPEPSLVAELEAFAAQGVQIVAFSETLEPRGFDVIRSGAEPRCHLAVEHLLEHHSRVGALTSSTSGFARYDAYVNTMRAAGRPILESDIEIFERHPEGAYRAAMALLSKPDRPTAIYCTTDFAAIAAVRAAHRLRLDVPGDVAVVGVGNTPEGEHLDPSLSTVGPVGFNEALARIIVGRLTDREGAPGEVFDFPWQLIVRESSRA
ncbi:DNA-binding LacI/PurR family transcriptional regulator [Kribbella antiqua]|uniref:DNA-binding LacI/PurR family transcriptional regulator n=1 Tax=Kribbella antiqua TaxID=2512217 RepID=A0A4R2IGN6_9ACTN|nr:LacI family DNA-binding transcriptional regulator [Kribbella antiqua]TCO44001.1 DNA-binding LacI/PurR family transcriptional regulator [Kribbella antiqua]